MKLSLSTAHGEIVLDLMDNSFTRRWLDHWVWMYEHFPLYSMANTYPVYIDVSSINPIDGVKHMAIIDTNIQRLYTSVRTLMDIGTGFPYTVEIASLRAGGADGQQILNVMHRAFTNIFRCDSSGLPYSWYDDNRDAFSVSPNDKKLFLDSCANINTVVHQLERYMITQHKKSLSVHPAKRFELEFDCFNTSADSKIMAREAILPIQPQDDLYYSDSTEYDVWVGKDILGKDYMAAFFDNDDPTEWDVSGIQWYTGKIEIDMTPCTFVDKIRSREVAQWLAQHGLDYSPRMAGIPLGNIIRGRELLPLVLADAKPGTPAVLAYQITE